MTVRSSKNSTNKRLPEAVLAGLPADVMASLVDDMAEATVGMLLSQTAIESDEDEREASNLRAL
jgi:hypothetical protein